MIATKVDGVYLTESSWIILTPGKTMKTFITSKGIHTAFLTTNDWSLRLR